MTQTALVTGGTGGLGRAVTRVFLDSGWRVVVPWIVEAELDGAPGHDRLELVRADLFDAGEAAAAVAAAGPTLRAVVNLVGGFAMGGRVHETPVEDFEAQFLLNLRPTYLVCAAAIPVLLENDPPDRGAIVCISSRAALRPFPGAAGYIASKGAVLAFVDALAAEYTQDGIRANAVLPSVIDTPANRASMPDADHATWVKPEEIARVIGFLCSEDAAPTAGAHLPVYGRA
jgi:NAD(P)-dependent dehydrogenase (short-subunit alcohol dehydrogenase family)